MHTFQLALSIAAITALIVYAFIVSFSSNRGTQYLADMTSSLRLLNARFEANETINADNERKEMEILQNKVKTACDRKSITADQELGVSFATLRQHVTRIADGPSVTDRSAWIKLKALTCSFDDSYFGHSSNRAQ